MSLNRNRLFFLLLLTGLFTSAQLSADNQGHYLPQEAINLANPYYQAAYPYKAQLNVVSRKIGNTYYRVERPNHALLHAMRKAAFSSFSVEILRGTKYPAGTWIEYFSNPLSKFYNPNFVDQLAFGMLMLRTGRTSESNTRYKEDADLSAKYFLEVAPASGFFPNQKDLDDYEFAIKTIGDPSKCFDTNQRNESIYTDKRGCSVDRFYIYNWIYGIHHVDLRRMVGYTKDQVLGTISSYLSVNSINSPEIKSIWNYAGALLKATGDSDMDTPGSRWGVYADTFYILSKDPVAARAEIAGIHDPAIEQIRKSKNLPVVPPISTPPSTSTPPEPPKDEVKIIFATNDKADPWFWYSLRPTETEAANNPLYSKESLAKNQEWKRFPPKDHLPWSYLSPEEGDKKLQTLTKTVPDRWVDPVSGKRYVALYHGTTSDVMDIFKKGEKAVRFDVATNKVLGMGFYLAASLNEAKFYACARLKERKPQDPNLKAMIAVFGVEENDLIKGKFSPAANLSDDVTGAPYDPEIFFKRNSKLYNQFNFFNNTHPYLKLASLVILPEKFETSNLRLNSDNDGAPTRTMVERGAASFTCPY
jgi:hypothetical protein